MRKRGSVFLKRGSRIVHASSLAFCASAKADQDFAGLNGLSKSKRYAKYLRRKGTNLAINIRKNKITQ